MTETQPQMADVMPSREEQLWVKLGIEVTEQDPNRLVGTMPVAGNRQPYGLLHGGASAVLAETLGSIAAAMHAAKKGRIALGLELSCTHHRSASEGMVTGVCTPLYVGGTVSSFEIAISNEDGDRICTARLTCVVREPPKST